MKSLTKTWFDFKNLSCNKNDCVFTTRLFWQKLEDENKKEKPMYVAVNTLSGAIDIFRQEEGEKVEKAIKTNKLNEIEDVLFSKLRTKGYVFPSKESEEIYFKSGIHAYKNERYQKNRILGFFAIDTGCSMGCEYCFEKQYKERGNELEKAIMTKEALEEGFKIITTMRDIQNREIDNVAGWGGEPLREKNYELNKIFIELANKNNIPIAYFSSLAEIGDGLIHLLSENADKIKFLSTTLDDLAEEHNSYRKLPNAFEKTVKNIDILLKANLPVIIRTNIGAHNIDKIPQLAEFYEKQGWFEYPKFKTFLTHTYDRHHVFEKEFTLSEDQAVSKFLKYRDEYPLVRKIQTLKFGPSLNNILKAFKLREVTAITEEDFEIPIKPIITYCNTSNGCEYVFTGKPDYSIYTCAECTALSKFKLGQYYPKLKLNKENLDMWGITDTLDHIRSIDTLDKCRDCAGATYCGGYCALEAVTANGNAQDIYCKKADEIIRNFLKNENHRLYKRARILLDNTEHITL